MTSLDTPSYIAVIAFAGAWGLAVGAGPVMTQAWMGRAAPDQLEDVGGLFLAVIQIGVALGPSPVGSQSMSWEQARRSI